MFDSDSLFNSSQASRSSAGNKGAGKGAGKNKDKRDQLKRFDHLAARLIQPFGATPIEKVPLKQLWEYTSKGDANVKYYSELAEKDNKAREGIGISRLAEILLIGIERVKSEHMRMFAKEDMLTDALAEANELEPSCRILNAQKKKRPRKSTLTDLMEDHTPAPTEEQVEQATKSVYEWLQKPTTPLRSLLAFLAQDGVFYSSYCAARVAEGWVKEKPTTLDDAQAAAKARICSEEEFVTTTPGANDSDGLFR